MKKIKYSLGLLFMTIVISCTDFVDPAIPYSDFETGGYLRTITAPGTFNFFALGSGTFTLTVESVDANDGKDVDEVEIFVRRRRGAALTTEVLLTTIPGSDFQTTSESKYLRANISIPLSNALTTMGLTNADLAGGDFVEYRLALHDTKGHVFTNTNLSADASSGAYYASPFLYRVAVVCPSDLGGTYSFVTTNIACDNCPGSVPGVAGCGPSTSGTGTLTATTTAGRYAVSDATFGQYACAWSDNPAAGVFFNDACLKVSTTGADQYGLVYTFTIISVSPDGKDLTIDWENDYGDAGRTVLTRTDAKTWPAGLTN
jgi:hypothetical protein